MIVNFAVAVRGGGCNEDIFNAGLMRNIPFNWQVKTWHVMFWQPAVWFMWEKTFWQLSLGFSLQTKEWQLWRPNRQPGAQSLFRRSCQPSRNFGCLAKKEPIIFLEYFVPSTLDVFNKKNLTMDEAMQIQLYHRVLTPPPPSRRREGIWKSKILPSSSPLG